jgi:hypothetical protein
MLLPLLLFINKICIERFSNSFEVADSTKNNRDVDIKLPIVQLYRKSELTGEFFFGEDIEETLRKLEYTLKTNLPTSILAPDINKNQKKNLYSYNQLKETIQSQDSIILFIQRLTCFRCNQIQPPFEKIISNYNIQYYSINIDDNPEFLDEIRFRISGYFSGKIKEFCTICNNTSYEICPECDALGYVQRNNIAVFCPQCTGYKKIRCRNCGGKCLKCS